LAFVNAPNIALLRSYSEGILITGDPSITDRSGVAMLYWCFLSAQMRILVASLSHIRCDGAAHDAW